MNVILKVYFDLIVYEGVKTIWDSPRSVIGCIAMVLFFIKIIDGIIFMATRCLIPYNVYIKKCLLIYTLIMITVSLTSVSVSYIKTSNDLSIKGILKI